MFWKKKKKRWANNFACGACRLSDFYLCRIVFGNLNLHIMIFFCLHSRRGKTGCGVDTIDVGAGNGKSGVNYLKFILKASFPDARSRGKCVYMRRARCVNFRAISRQFPDPFSWILRGKREKDRRAWGSRMRLRIPSTFISRRPEKCSENKIRDHVISNPIAKKKKRYWSYWYFFICILGEKSTIQLNLNKRIYRYSLVKFWFGSWIFLSVYISPNLLAHKH